MSTDPITFYPTNITDWLHLSPTHQDQCSPLQDLSCSARINTNLDTDLNLNFVYQVIDQISAGNFITQDAQPAGTPDLPSFVQPPTIFNAHYRMLSVDSTTTLFNSPSTRTLALLSPSTTAVQSQTPPLWSLSSSPTGYSSLGLTQKYELHSPLRNLFDTSGSYVDFDRDVSPVVRASQLKPSPVPKIPEKKLNKTQRRKKRKDSQKSKPMFMDKLLSASQGFSLEGPTTSSNMAAECLPVLRSPCKLVPSQVTVTDIRNFPVPVQEKEYHLTNLEQVDVHSTPLGDATLSSTPLRPTYSIPSSPLTPLTPLTSSPTPIPQTLMRPKRRLADIPSPTTRSKRHRIAPLTQPSLFNDDDASSSAASSPSTMSSPLVDLPLTVFSNRTFPTSVEMSSHFSLFYRRFPASSYYQPADFESPCSLFRVRHPGGTYNPPRSMLDLYTPRFVKGKGAEKVGLCPICIEPCDRGGEQKKLWLAMKFSAFKCYHMQYAHGISASTGRPFSPALEFRIVPRQNPGKKEKTHIQQGKCHKCLKWVAVEGIKDMECKVKELHWWKHAAGCHQNSVIEGEADLYEDDDVLKRLLELEEENGV